MNYFALALIALTAVAAYMGTRWLAIHAERLGLVQAPIERSSHIKRTPHGGGLALVLAFLSAIAVSVWLELLESSLATVLLLGGGSLAAIGLWDDKRMLPASGRLIAQAAASAFAIMLLGAPTPAVVPFPLGLIAATACFVWWLNAYNFMDGIDGIASVECLFISLAALLFLACQGSHSLPGNALALWLLSAATAGFLCLNWPPARIFLGDVGSLFLAYALGAAALSLSEQGQLPFACWLVLGSVFWVDSTATLLRRMLRGENWHQAHRSHAYQRYASQLGRYYESRGLEAEQARATAHRRTVTVVLCLNLLWLLPLAWLVIIQPDWLLLWIGLAWAPPLALVLHSSKYD